MCEHQPPCPDAAAFDRDAARVTVAHPTQGWSLLCNGVILFEDTGELLPDGSCIQPHRGPAPHNLVPAIIGTRSSMPSGSMAGSGASNQP
jgi:hypothetical protein